MGRLSSPWLAVLLTASIATAWAEDDPFFAQLPVVASVSRLPQRLADAPVAVSVVDREMIKAAGVRDLNDIFRLVPGFQTYPNNTDAARVTYHGLTDEDYSPRVQVLVDGRSLHSPLFRNGANWATIPVAIEDIERIEVVRGSNTVSYGTNAFLGVINIITVDPALTQGFSVSTSYGNQGVRDYTLRKGGRIGEVGDFRVTYQQKDDDGLKDRFDWKDKLSSRLFDLRADVQIDERNSLQFGLGHAEAITLRGRLASSAGVLTGGESAGNPFRDYSQSSSYMQLLWRRALSADSDLLVRYSYMADWASDAFNISSGGYLYRVDDYGDNGARQEMEIQHNFVPFEHVRLVWGGSWRSDSARSESLFVGKGTIRRDVSRLFGNLEWKPAGWFTGNTGMSAENDSLAGFRVAPRVSGNFHLNRENTLRLGYSRAYRTGSIFDYQGNFVISPYATAGGGPLPVPLPPGAVATKFVGNPGLAPEKLDTLEIGYLGDWQDLRMSLDVRLFSEHIPNRQLQVFGSATVADTPAPIQNVRIQGLEYQWKWQPVEATRLLLNQTFIHNRSSFLDSALTGVLAATEQEALVMLDRLAEQSAPKYSTSILLSQRLPYGLEFSAAGYWVGTAKWTRNSAVRAYTRFDARLGYPFRIAGWNGELALTVQSLDGGHGEFKANGSPADRVVDRRQWLTVRFDL